ncbi:MULTISPECIES: sulfotransferase [Asticcacaulis]|uniref:tetratricopeptide repeat-containing sulfotransferase family protein n=1 Tax=Asticcacaulis TaxID=76890 RepID=UPI001AE45038|nr:MULTISPECIES: sulfotransferase [Asticcacaulis]MBP2159343.1 tetratricopeptide (TPR) repeat protein [Asticcacaulis solisilvae]MDR6800388.1 tetratricopeptide (TPR) repeat protein [Asticcacaulis sp. BE141]
MSKSSPHSLDARSARAINAGLRNPRLMTAAVALQENRIDAAEPLLRAHLKDDPFDVAAIRMLAEVAARIGRWRDSENLLRRALELSPGFGAARANLATVLYRQGRAADAIAELDQLIGPEIDAENFGAANLKAAALGRIGEFEEGIAIYEALLNEQPNQPKVWMSYAHALKTIGRTDDGVKAYRKALAIAPHLGEVWWSLANLKVVRFSDEDITAMEKALADPNLSDTDQLHLDFALGKALEDRKDYAASFARYDSGNAIRRKSNSYKAADTTAFVDDCIALFTPEFFAERQGWGCQAADPIFVLGMPRAGSTLIEQILSSHSQIEGTQELPDIPALARRGGNYPQRLSDLPPETFKTLGEEYLSRTRIHRKSGRPHFVDKLPNNWVHTGFIRLILPNATIIDARRHPLACGFSNFKQHFARGQDFSYALDDMGRYYADYVRLMTHIDTVLPNFVHRTIHEQLIDSTETEIRALISACGLEFEEGTLRFFETDRAVRTPSSEQVRRPINRDGADAWQGFEPWLDPLKQALGPVLDAYPKAP